MSTASRTWGVQETLLDPPALPPPPVRHALLVFLIALTAILHLGTAGWGDIQNGSEGELAGGARGMLNSERGLVPLHHGTALPGAPPLAFWLVVASYKLLGVTAFAARLPTALALICSVGLTFWIGERLSGYWRGFVAGLIQLCSLGTFIWCFSATPEPLFTALAQGAVFCLVCGYQTRRKRDLWYAGFWACTAFAFLTKGMLAFAFLGTMTLLLTLLFREAPLRFAGLLRWKNLLPLVVIIGCWSAWAEVNGANVGGLSWPAISLLRDDVPFRSFVAALLLWLFPGALLIAPALLVAPRKVFRMREFDFADALPLCWIAAGIFLLLALREPAGLNLVALSPAFALLAATAWERTLTPLRLAGLALTAVGCVAIASEFQSSRVLWWIGARGPMESLRYSPALMAAVIGGIASLLAAAYFGRGDRERLAICLAAMGMLPLGLSAAELVAQLGPRLSFGTAARGIQEHLREGGEVLYLGPASSGSSLEFYLERQPVFIDDKRSSATTHTSISTEEAVARLGAAHPVYLIFDKTRAASWQERLTARYHIYHQVSTCGQHVVVTNQP